jgi:hypothetical protein
VTSTRDSDEEMSADACLTLLSNARRRAVLLSINDREADEPIPIEEVVAGSLPDPVEVALNHNHLPKLEKHDVVRWNRERGTVAAGPAFGRIEPFIESLDGNRERLPDDWRVRLGR